MQCVSTFLLSGPPFQHTWLLTSKTHSPNFHPLSCSISLVFFTQHSPSILPSIHSSQSHSHSSSYVHNITEHYTLPIHVIHPQYIPYPGTPIPNLLNILPLLSPSHPNTIICIFYSAHFHCVFIIAILDSLSMSLVLFNSWENNGAPHSLFTPLLTLVSAMTFLCTYYTSALAC